MQATTARTSPYYMIYAMTQLMTVMIMYVCTHVQQKCTSGAT